MRTRDIWRIAALMALILATLGLALGACMAKTTESSGSSTVVSPETGDTDRASPDKPSPNKPPLPPHATTPDAGAEAPKRPTEGRTLGTAPRPVPGPMKPRKAGTKGHKGMVGQMHLQDGD